jgi:hypothetical protein
MAARVISVVAEDKSPTTTLSIRHVCDIVNKKLKKYFLCSFQLHNIHPNFMKTSAAILEQSYA